MRVCIDPGHQFFPDLKREPISPNSNIKKPRCAPGARGIRSKLPEYEIVLQIALLTEKELTKHGIDVILTRRSNEINLSNIERAKIANQSGSQFCIKIHCNGVRPYLRYFAFWKRGLMTLIPSNDCANSIIYENSRLIGQIIHNNLLSITTFPDLGIKIRKDITGFNWSKIPVVLCEIGYLTSPIEDAFLSKRFNQIKTSSTIAESILDINGQIKF